MSCIVCSWSHAAVRNGYCRRNKKLGILGIDMGFLMEKFFMSKNIKTAQSCKEFYAESETTFGFPISATVAEKSHRRHLRLLPVQDRLLQITSSLNAAYLARNLR